MPRRILRSRANQFAADPESQVRMQFSGRRGDSSQNTRCGLMGLASSMALSSRSFHHFSTPFDALAPGAVFPRLEIRDQSTQGFGAVAHQVDLGGIAYSSIRPSIAIRTA